MDWASLATRPAELVLVAGPNGSGKSTIAESYIEKRFPIWPKLNADQLLIGLGNNELLESEPHPMLQAARIVDIMAKGLVVLGEPFVLETVLSSPKYEVLVRTARRVGLIFRLVYVTTESSDINVGRVRQRVEDGGHDVPEDRIHSRWERSMDNLPWFARRADRLIVADNSGASLKVLALRHLSGVLELREHHHPASQRLRPLVGQPVLDDDGSS
ncbi:MAG: AAA family ATPase [Myxococcota bacterium]